MCNDSNVYATCFSTTSLNDNPIYKALAGNEIRWPLSHLQRWLPVQYLSIITGHL